MDMSHACHRWWVRVEQAKGGALSALKRARATHTFIEVCSNGQRLSSLMPWANRQHLSKGHIFPRLYVLHVACVIIEFK